ncbi:MAG TPA: tetratricopeptide repeat protein [Gammaproteobacteria bacterium]|nr:tetratricopeptide repeat protein [Gammaproteobacteria bacterium]
MIMLADIKQLQQSGQLEEAKHGYLALLQANPKDVVVLHLLGLLYVEQGELNAAQDCFAKALHLKPEDVNIRLHFANTFKAKGLYDQASQILQSIIREHPQFSAAFNNLGTIYFMQGKWQEAISAYQSAIELQSNYIDAYYNLGLAYNKLNRKKEAMCIYEAILELAPQHVGAHFQISCLLMQDEKYPLAIEHLSIIEQAHTSHFETKTNFATCLFKLGRLSEAKFYYLEALILSPSDTQLFFNLGVIETQLGRMSSATDFYLQALKINPDFFEVYYNLGVLSLRTKGPEVALGYFHEALRLQPHNTIVQHLIDVLTQDKHLSTLPADFVNSLFDSYADHYDVHLIDILHYQLPQLFLKQINELVGDAYQQWFIVDLGCGTGLCGKYFKTKTNTVIGVDLSKKILDVAAKKHIYDELILCDVLLFLADKHHLYDLIIAGDVLGYVGDLSVLFSHTQQALKKLGLFVFSAEISEQVGYHVTPFGRFVYNKHYLDQLVMQNQLTVVRYERVTLRTENNVPVLGHLYVVRYT